MNHYLQELLKIRNELQPLIHNIPVELTDNQLILQKLNQQNLQTKPAIEKVSNLLTEEMTLVNNFKGVLVHLRNLQQRNKEMDSILKHAQDRYQQLVDLREKMIQTNTCIDNIKEQCDHLGITRLTDPDSLKTSGRSLVNYIFPVGLFRSGNLIEFEDEVDEIKLKPVKRGDSTVEVLPYNTVFLMSGSHQMRELCKEVNKAIEKQEKIVQKIKENCNYYQHMIDQVNLIFKD